MNPFIFSFVALCVAQGAIAQYQQQGNSYGGHQNSGYQRKMSPSPQSYGAQSAGNHYQQQQQQQHAASSYGNEMSSYEQPQQSYRAPSSAAVSTYDERSPAASSGYGKSAAAPAAAASYGRQQQAASYQAPAYQQQQSYAKAAPKYEEPSYPPMPFAWGYDINDGYGGAQYHKESGDEYGKRTGSYGYTDAYGVYRQVDYVADEHGFRATIKTNEPGTANESPADVELHAYEPPSNYYAGNTQQSYGSGQKSAYAAPASSYGRQSSSSSSSSYAAPASSGSYGNQQRSASYGGKSAMSSYQQRPSNSYDSHSSSNSQYSAASALVPVYQKAASIKKY